MEFINWERHKYHILISVKKMKFYKIKGLTNYTWFIEAKEGDDVLNLAKLQFRLSSYSLLRALQIIQENAVFAYFSCLILCESSLATVFPSFSHCTSGVGTPVALQSSWTLSPRRTLTSLGISEPAILGGTGNAPWRRVSSKKHNLD